ncbi:hypothetical protein [uncultured Amphritea sp.]|uniref:hypothetical protein n=1 Tax=uncultured Amphritea sp. TaxID=981605 RepID=UPI0025E22704|nr:hypothetical protein [uncultured Amphritea sp.]
MNKDCDALTMEETRRIEITLKFYLAIKNEGDTYINLVEAGDWEPYHIDDSGPEIGLGRFVRDNEPSIYVSVTDNILFVPPDSIGQGTMELFTLSSIEKAVKEIDDPIEQEEESDWRITLIFSVFIIYVLVRVIDAIY